MVFAYSSGVLLLGGLVVVGFGLLAFNRAHLDRHAAGGFGSGLSPAGREFLSVVLILFGLATMFAGAIAW